MKTLLETPKQTTKTGVPPAKRPIWCSVLFAVPLLTLALGLTPSSFGQGITGSIAGTVTDPSGAGVPGATVTVREVDTNATRIVTTSDIGSYTVTQLAPGSYSVKVDKTGFKTFQQNDITLQINQLVQINAELGLGSQQETVVVTGGCSSHPDGRFLDWLGRRHPDHPEYTAEWSPKPDGSDRSCSRSPGRGSAGPACRPGRYSIDRHRNTQLLWRFWLHPRRCHQPGGHPSAWRRRSPVARCHRAVQGPLHRRTRRVQPASPDDRGQQERDQSAPRRRSSSSTAPRAPRRKPSSAARYHGHRTSATNTAATSPVPSISPSSTTVTTSPSSSLPMKAFGCHKPPMSTASSQPSPNEGAISPRSSSMAVAHQAAAVPASSTPRRGCRFQET